MGFFRPFSILVMSLMVSTAFAEPPRSVWNLKTPKAALALAKAMSLAVTGQELKAGQEVATCTVNVVKPSFESEAVANEGNLALCLVFSKTDGVREIRWDLSKELISPWGNHFGPFGVSISGKAAEALWDGMKKVYDADKDSNEYLLSDDNAFKGGGVVYSFIDYAISTVPRTEERTAAGADAMSCMKYDFYTESEGKPEKPVVRCDFIL